MVSIFHILQSVNCVTVGTHETGKRSCLPMKMPSAVTSQHSSKATRLPTSVMQTQKALEEFIEVSGIQTLKTERATFLRASPVIIKFPQHAVGDLVKKAFF